MECKRPKQKSDARDDVKSDPKRKNAATDKSKASGSAGPAAKKPRIDYSDITSSSDSDSDSSSESDSDSKSKSSKVSKKISNKNLPALLKAVGTEVSCGFMIRILYDVIIF